MEPHLVYVGPQALDHATFMRAALISASMTSDISIVNNLIKLTGVQTFKLSIDGYLQFWVTNYEFGCFSHRREFIGDDADWPCVDAWLFGIINAKLIIELVKTDYKFGDGSAIKFELPMGKCIELLMVAPIPLEINRLQPLYDILNRAPVDELKYPLLFYPWLGRYYPGFSVQTAIQFDRPQWRRGLKTDRLFRPVMLTVLLMIKYRAANFKINKDLTTMLLGYVFAAHLDWLKEIMMELNADMEARFELDRNNDKWNQDVGSLVHEAIGLHPQKHRL